MDVRGGRPCAPIPDPEAEENDDGVGRVLVVVVRRLPSPPPGGRAGGYSVNVNDPARLGRRAGRAGWCEMGELGAVDVAVDVDGVHEAPEIDERGETPSV